MNTKEIKTHKPTLDDALIEYEVCGVDQDLGTKLYSFRVTSVVLWGVDLTDRFHDWTMEEEEMWEHVFDTLNIMMEELR